VNFILRDDFEGLEVSLGHQTTAESSQDTNDVSILAGTNLSDKTNLMVAASFLQQDPMSSAERPYTTINAVSTLGRSFLNLGGLAPGLPPVIDGGRVLMRVPTVQERRFQMRIVRPTAVSSRVVLCLHWPAKNVGSYTAQGLTWSTRKSEQTFLPF